jgi:hypothetical protein
VLVYTCVQLITLGLRKEGRMAAGCGLRDTFANLCLFNVTCELGYGHTLHICMAKRAEPVALAIDQALNPVPGSMPKLIV